MESKAVFKSAGVALAATASLALVGCGGSDSTTESNSTTTATESASTASETVASANGGGQSAPICTDVPAQEDRSSEPALAKPKQAALSGNWSIKFETSCGDFTVKLDTKNSPKTSASLAYLTKSGFYDGLAVNRVAAGFVVQAGSPTGDTSGDAGYKIREAPAKNFRYKKGVLAMAKGGSEPAGTSSSQFFVALDNIQLPAEYAVEIGRAHV